MGFLSILTSLPDVVKRWLVLAVVAASSFALGHVNGLVSEQREAALREVQRVEQVRVFEKKAQEISDQHAKVVYVEKEKIRVVYKSINKGVTDYVNSTPSASIPSLSSNFSMLYNAAALGCDPSEPSCRAHAEVSGDVAPAEVLEINIEAQRLYQECRITVTGWQEFYTKLKEHYDASAHK